MARKRNTMIGKGRNHSFVQFPHYMLTDPALLSLSGKACKLLLYLAGQYRGDNNGDLQATYKLAAAAGWTSKANLASAIAELEEACFIERTRQGGRHRCSLFALTWFPINDCDGKLDVRASRVASNAWRKSRTAAPPVGQCAPPMGQCRSNPAVSASD
jgi:hypothetical protein